jgi:hypothetical protein
MLVPLQPYHCACLLDSPPLLTLALRHAHKPTLFRPSYAKISRIFAKLSQFVNQPVFEIIRKRVVLAS